MRVNVVCLVWVSGWAWAWAEGQDSTKDSLHLSTDEKSQLLSAALQFQQHFKKTFEEGKFPKFAMSTEEEASAIKRLESNPYYHKVDAPTQGHADAAANANTERPMKEWWVNKTDDQVAAKFKMTPEQFRKASTSLLQWLDHRMSDLDDLYDQTLAVGRMTGIPVDRIIDKNAHPQVVQWIEISQKAAGNPFAAGAQTSSDGHRFKNPIKELIGTFQQQVRTLHTLVDSDGTEHVDLSKLADLSRDAIFRYKNGNVMDPATQDLSGRVQGVDNADRGFVESFDAPAMGLDANGGITGIMDLTTADNDDNDNGLEDVLDSTRGSLGPDNFGGAEEFS